MPFHTRLRMTFAASVLLAATLLGLGTAGRAQTASPTTGPTTSSSTTRPNVVVILVDDMGFSDIGCYGSEISTPNLDALAAQGVRLRQFYNTGRCCPTRATLLTGVYAHEAGVGHMTGGNRPAGPYQGFLNTSCVTFAEALRPAGYETLMVGKWHVGWGDGHVPLDRGFDHFYGSQAGGFYYRNNVGPGRAVWNDRERVAVRPRELPEDFYSTDVWTDQGMRLVDDAVAQRKPFMLYVAHNAPHFPIQAPADLVAKYRGRYLNGWEPMRTARLARQRELGLIDASLALTQPEANVPSWSSLSAEQKDRYDGMMASYAACVERMDYNVGRLVDHLKQIGQFDNTLILFMSDNGGNAESGIEGRSDNVQRDRWGGPATTIFVGKCWATLNNTPFRKFKHFIQEGGISSPLIMSWPARLDPSLRGTFVTGPGHIVDVMPTLLDATGAAYPTVFNGQPILAMEGTSLLPILTHQPIARSKPLWWEHEGNAGIREGNLKLVRIEGQGWELYDLSKDRVETNDLAMQRPDETKRLAADWQTIADRVGVKPWNEISKQFGEPAAASSEQTTQPTD